MMKPTRMTYVYSEDSDQPACLQSLMSNQSSLSNWRSFGAMDIHRDYADAQADLSFCWVHTSFVGFAVPWLILLSDGSSVHIQYRP